MGKTVCRNSLHGPSPLVRVREPGIVKGVGFHP